jgi:hypothetical protein
MHALCAKAVGALPLCIRSAAAVLGFVSPRSGRARRRVPESLKKISVELQRAGFAKTLRFRPQLFHSACGTFPQFHTQERFHLARDSLAASRDDGYIR